VTGGYGGGGGLWSDFVSVVYFCHCASGKATTAQIFFVAEGGPDRVLLWTAQSFVLRSQEETRKNVFKGERGPLPPILAPLFSTGQKRGRGFEPPQIFGAATKSYCQRARKHRKTPENAAKRRKTPDGAKRRTHKTLQNAAKEDR